MTGGRERVLFLGPLPPPFMGPTVATDIILSSKLAEEFDLEHVDTSDHRELTRLAALDFTNFRLAFQHYLRLLGRLFAGGVRLVYIPIMSCTAEITVQRKFREYLVSIMTRNFCIHLLFLSAKLICQSPPRIFL